MKKVLVSIVTVSYNAGLVIEKTIRSIISQNYGNIQYLIIDGGSTDGTQNVINKYSSFIDYFISEPDKGIYDAMNKAIDVATGEWIIFMNAGDCFVHESVLSDIFSMQHECVDVLYGDVQAVYPWGNMLMKARSFSQNDINLPFCHQSTLVKTKWMKKYKFDLSYKVAADYHFMYRLYKEGKQFNYINYTISQFEMGGFSSKQVLRTFTEVVRANGRRKEIKYRCQWCYLWVRGMIMEYLPQPLVDYVRQKKYT